MGRLLQRFSRDLDMIDSQLPSNLSSVVTSFLSIFGAMATILMSYPSFAVVLAAITPFYLHYTNYFRRVVREVKRVEGISRAPIFSHFGELWEVGLGWLTAACDRPLPASQRRLFRASARSERSVGSPTATQLLWPVLAPSPAALLLLPVPAPMVPLPVPDRQRPPNASDRCNGGGSLRPPNSTQMHALMSR